MKSRSRNKILSVLLILAMVITMMPTIAFAGTDVTYTKVTEAPEDWSGEYLLVYEEGNVILDGSLETIDAVNNTSAVTISDNSITMDDNSKSVTIEAVEGGGYVMKSASGKYLYAPSDKNAMSASADKSTAAKYPLTIEVKADGTDIALSSGPHMRFNAAADQNRFRYYKSTTYTNQKPVALYKLSEASAVTVAAPMASPAAGEVEKGTQITLTTTTENATIFYTLDGSTPTKDSKTYSDAAKPVITEDCTLKAVAILNGTSSAVQTVKYTVKNDTAADLEEGDYVIYAPAYTKALSTTKTGNYNVGVDVTVADGKMTGYGDTEVWTVTRNDDGTYSFSNGGKNLGMADSYASMDLGAVNDKWELTSLGGGLFNVKNTVRGNFMEWYAKYSNWSTYNSASAATDDQFQIAFFPVEKAPLEEGDYVIYAPAYNKALSTTKTGNYNVGVDVTIADGKMTGYGDTEVWTVTRNDDGTYSFSNGGKNLGMADSYASMDLGAVNDKWELTSLGGGLFNVKNTVRGNFMEWYAKYSNWSTYNSASAATDDQFQIAFFPVEKQEGDIDPEIGELEVQATPGSGASVEAGQLITLKAAAGTEIYFTMSADGKAPADPVAATAEQKYTSPVEITSTPEAGKPVIIKAVAYIPASGSDPAKVGKIYTFTYKAPVKIGDFTLYFGQLHSHTNLSDGTGSVTDAFKHASGVANLDFLAVTDHSNWFEGQTGTPAAGTTHLGDENAREVNAKWDAGKQAASDITTSDFVGIYGFEMTWSGGSPGHINTFNSQGFENRNAAPYKKGDNYEVMQAYFNTLNENPETISQFNHPGDTFGDFMDFALYSPTTDNQITMVEVGNGEGPIGSSGYFPSYSYYTRALDKGWHVAPTNNQDNHKGNWGDSNTARSVVLADSLTEEGIYDAIKNYRVYATEDNDLSILYTLNGNAMGSILDNQDKVDIEVSLNDPTDTEGKTKVEVIVNGGQTIAESTVNGSSGTVKFENLTASYGYYYIRVTQADKNIAVTAPVWVGESINAGVSNTSSDIAMPIKGDEINISSEIFNNVSSDMTVTSLTYTLEGQTSPIHTADVSTIGTDGVVGSRKSFTYSFPYVTAQAGGFNINVEMKVLIDGEEYTFTDVLKLSISDSSIATRVLIDGTHYNDYVNGYYSGNMTNFINLGIAQNIQVKIAQPGTTIPQLKEMLNDTSLFVISSPLKYTSDYTGDAKVSVFEDEFVELVKEYVAGGGTIIVCGLADYQDSSSGVPYTTYEQANKLLKGVGSTMRVNDDELLDQDENGGQPYRLYFDKFNYSSSDEVVKTVLDGVKDSGLTYSSYSGCSVDKGEGEAIVFGHPTTYSINSKDPAQGHDKPKTSYSDAYDPEKAVVKKGEVVSMATEKVGQGRVFVTGTVFCSNFELSAEDKPTYANSIIAENILKMVKKEPVISTIQEARAGDFGEVFTVIGTVANGTAESGNAFFDTIYIQDEKGNGINVFPINDNTIKRGDRVMITGAVSEYIGDKQLSAINVTVLEGQEEVVINDVTTKEADDYDTNFGMLVRVKGYVKSVTMAGDLIESIVVEDESGVSCRLFIDGYIGYSDENSAELETFVKEGAYISGIGFVSHNAEGNRLRVRDRSEIIPATAPSGDINGDDINNSDNGDKTDTNKPNTGDASNVLLWTILLIVSGGMTAKISVSSKRKQEER